MVNWGLVNKSKWKLHVTSLWRVVKQLLLGFAHLWCLGLYNRLRCIASSHKSLKIVVDCTWHLWDYRVHEPDVCSASTPGREHKNRPSDWNRRWQNCTCAIRCRASWPFAACSETCLAERHTTGIPAAWLSWLILHMSFRKATTIWRESTWYIARTSSGTPLCCTTARRAIIHLESALMTWFLQNIILDEQPDICTIWHM